MYILFVNSGDKCDIFFSAQFNNKSNKKNWPTHGIGLGRVELMGLTIFFYYYYY